MLSLRVVRARGLVLETGQNPVTDLLHATLDPAALASVLSTSPDESDRAGDGGRGDPKVKMDVQEDTPISSVVSLAAGLLGAQSCSR